MQINYLTREQFLPISIQEAWDFFSSPINLSKITPSDMGFKVLTQLNGEPIFTGMKIDYVVKPLFSIPLRWTTEITWVMAPSTFIDTQLKGPYALWEHTHNFVPVEGGVKMTDDLKYALPFGPLGSLVHILLVKEKLENIFNFRKEALIIFFGEYKKS